MPSARFACGGQTHDRAVQRVQAQEAEFRSYVRDTAGARSPDQLAKLADLRDHGVISPTEFEHEKPRSWPDHRPRLPLGRCLDHSRAGISPDVTTFPPLPANSQHAK